MVTACPVPMASPNRRRVPSENTSDSPVAKSFKIPWSAGSSRLKTGRKFESLKT